MCSNQLSYVAIYNLASQQVARIMQICLAYVNRFFAKKSLFFTVWLKSRHIGAYLHVKSRMLKQAEAIISSYFLP